MLKEQISNQETELLSSEVLSSSRSFGVFRDKGKYNIALIFLYFIFFPPESILFFFHEMFKVHFVPSLGNCQCECSTDLPLGKGINEAYPLFLNHLAKCKLCFAVVLNSLCIISMPVHVNSILLPFQGLLCNMANVAKIMNVD